MIIIDNLNNISNYKTLDKIIDFTQNTWQLNRSKSEKTKDTKIGKLAENVLETYFQSNFYKLEYLSYDTFRMDNLEKHAPFDGIIYDKNISSKSLKLFIDRVNNEITNNQWGKISNSLKSELEKSKIFTVEVKSTRVTDRHKRNGHDSDSVELSILKDDFLEYPTRLRTDRYNRMDSLEDYITFCEKSNLINCPNGSDKNQIIRDFEQQNMRYFYFRIYIDEGLKRAYIVGYIDKFDFSSLFVWKKMKKYNKSEHALYLSVPLKHSRCISNFNINGR